MRTLPCRLRTAFPVSARSACVRGVVLLSVCEASLGVTAAAADASAVTTTITTSGETAYTVPLGTTALQVTVVGAHDVRASTTAAAGLGADVQAILTLTPGSTLYAEVAGPGGAGRRWRWPLRRRRRRRRLRRPDVLG